MSILKIAPAHKVVLSGLSENSWGAGTYKRTVWHALVMEDFDGGRMKRKKKDFLCTPKSRPFDTGFPHQSSQTVPKVNCKSCAAILARVQHEIIDSREF